MSLAKKEDRKMMWEKTGPKTYKASNGSGFEAEVIDCGNGFVVMPKESEFSVQVRSNSLDALKLAVTEMAMRRAS